MKVEDPILTVESLTKTYPKDGQSFHALNDLSFTLKKGEILGIIGRNGAGKSTLLKVLSQITSPSSGEITYKGQLTSIIDIGTGFHADLSGEANIYLSSLLMGYSKPEIKALYNQIVDFSGLHDFMHMPVKHYSSGMYLRLAFSIAFHARISILLLDEVIAVGDSDFKRKCYSKIHELKENGTSIILVSHNLELIIQQCDRCLLLDSGKIIYEGSPFDTVYEYHALIENNESINIRAELHEKQTSEDFSVISKFPLSIDDFEVTSIQLIADGIITTDSSFTLRFQCSKFSAIGSFELVLYLSNMNGIRVLLDSYAFRKHYGTTDMLEGNYTVDVTIPSDLLSAGFYRVGLQICSSQEIQLDIETVAKFRIFPNEMDMKIGRAMGSVIRPKLNWNVAINEGE